MKNLLCLAMWAAVRLHGSSICVTVRDPGSMSLPGASVNVVNLADSRQQHVELSDMRGRVCLKNLPEGLYSVQVSLVGFLTVKYFPVRIAYPSDSRLAVQMLLGEVSEGGLLDEAVVSGTLRLSGELSPAVKICIVERSGRPPVTCTVTDELGQYALSIPPGSYIVELFQRGKKIGTLPIDLPTGGYYRDRITRIAPQ